MICGLNINLNPCSRLEQNENAQALEALVTAVCELSTITQNHYFSVLGTAQPAPYDQPEAPPAFAVQDGALLFEQHTDIFSIWTFDYSIQTWVLEQSIPYGAATVANTTNCVVDIDQFAGPTFTDKMNQAIAFLDAGGKLDLTNQTADHIITDTIIFSKSITVLWPSQTFSFTGVGDMFDFQANQIKFIGTGRSPKRTAHADVTVFDMQSGRYHIHSRGFGLFDLSGFDCFGIESADDENEAGTAPGGALSGSGGLYFEKADPGTTSGGNNVTGLFLKDIYIEDCYAHGVYMDTTILSKLTNIRVSGARGHGFYMNAGTSTVFESCFCAKAYEAGFCIQSAAYCSLIGCASETSGIGYWFRSVQGISVFSSGGESNKNAATGIIPVDLSTLAGDDVTPVAINDISSDFLNDFRGNTWLITGGQGISLISPYSTNIGQAHAIAGTTNLSRHFKFRGNTRGVTITNPRIDINSGATVENRFDWEFDDLGGDSPSDVAIYYDPADGTITPLIDSYFTSNNIAGESTYIRTDTDDVVFYAGQDLYTPNSHGAPITPADFTPSSIRIGSGIGTQAAKSILLES